MSKSFMNVRRPEEEANEALFNPAPVQAEIKAEEEKPKQIAKEPKETKPTTKREPKTETPPKSKGGTHRAKKAEVVTEQRSRRVQLLFTEKLHSDAVKIAEVRRISLNDLVNSVLQEYVDENISDADKIYKEIAKLQAKLNKK